MMLRISSYSTFVIMIVMSTPKLRTYIKFKCTYAMSYPVFQDFNSNYYPSSVQEFLPLEIETDWQIKVS